MRINKRNLLQKRISFKSRFDEQRRIAEVLREQMAAFQKARAAAEEELSTINALPAALLRRVFAGEL